VTALRRREKRCWIFTYKKGQRVNRLTFLKAQRQIMSVHRQIQSGYRQKQVAFLSVV
jgi:hypothetical protein